MKKGTPEEECTPTLADGQEGGLPANDQARNHESPSEEEPESEGGQGSTERDEEGGVEPPRKDEVTNVPPARPSDEAPTQSYRRSIAMADRLDGVPPYGRSLRWRDTSDTRCNPYCVEVSLMEEDEANEEEEDRRHVWLSEELKGGKKMDCWEFVNNGRTLRRHHVRKRKMPFDPQTAKDLPCSLEELTDDRFTLN